MLNQPVEVELANHAVVGQDWLLDVLDLVAVTIVVEDVVQPNTEGRGVHDRSVLDRVEVRKNPEPLARLKNVPNG
jgi:hypothetical protein